MIIAGSTEIFVTIGLALIAIAIFVVLGFLVWREKRKSQLSTGGPSAQPPLVRRLSRTRDALGAAIGKIISRNKVDAQTWTDLEHALLLADIGLPTTLLLIDELKIRAKDFETSAELLPALESLMLEQLDRPRELACESKPAVWMFVGVNGTGKTTSIGKVANWKTEEGASVLLAAADTFRAAASEQLDQWSKRVGVPLVKSSEGADPGSVVFDAMDSAKAKSIDLVLVDTAGRLHTKSNLMDELGKVKRIIDKTPGALAEVLLVIDATTGQNGLAQAKSFTEAVDVTGIVLTKLDGTAKGGIVLSIERELNIPVKLAGIGESASDLVVFDAAQFVSGILEDIGN